MLIVWATLAIYYSNLPWAGLRLALAIAFAAFAIWAVWLSPQRRMSVALILLYLGVVAWWISISPSHDRQWRPEVAVMPRAYIDGDRVRLTGVRNFEYRTRDDFTVRYEEREVSLSHLTALDFYVSYWSEGLVGHTFLSFMFDNAPPLSISIETRPEVGEGKQQFERGRAVRDRLLQSVSVSRTDCTLQLTEAATFSEQNRAA